MGVMCVLMLFSIFFYPFEQKFKNPCRFKILKPKYIINGNKKIVIFDIIVKRKHRYFINFPLLFKFYSNQNFKTFVKISYSTPDEEKQVLLETTIEFNSKMKEHIFYITDIIVGKITIEIMLEIEYGNPIIGFEIMKNNTCELIKEHKIELTFP